MNFLDIILFKPIINALVFLYNILGSNFGLAIIALTIIIKTALYPLTKKSIKTQKAMEVLGPKMKEIQDKYKNDKQKQAQGLSDLYKKHNIHPLSGCLPLLIQLPILIALYRVLLTAFDPGKLNLLYAFVHRPETLDPLFFGIIDLSVRNVYLAVITGVVQLIYSFIIKPKKTSRSSKNQGMDLAKNITSQMTYFFPVITVVILLKLPAGLAFYWMTTTLYSIFEYIFIKKPKQDVIKQPST